jgi:hypothetical protein
MEEMENQSTLLLTWMMELNLPGEMRKLNLQWTNEQTRTEVALKCSLQISARESSTKFKFENVYAIDNENISLPSQTQNGTELCARYQHLKGLKIPSFVNAKPRILIGLDQAHVLASGKSIKGPEPDQPVASNTPLGWVVYGQTEVGGCRSSLSACHVPVLITSAYEPAIEPTDDEPKLLSSKFIAENAARQEQHETITNNSKTGLKIGDLKSNNQQSITNSLKSKMRKFGEWILNGKIAVNGTKTVCESKMENIESSEELSDVEAASEAEESENHFSLGNSAEESSIKFTRDKRVLTRLKTEEIPVPEMKRLKAKKRATNANYFGSKVKKKFKVDIQLIAKVQRPQNQWKIYLENYDEKQKKPGTVNRCFTGHPRSATKKNRWSNFTPRLGGECC